MEETTITTRNHRHARRWPRVMAIILLIIALLGLLYWWRMPRHLHQVARYTDAYESSIVPFATGFLYTSDSHSIVMRRWNGKPYWEVKNPLPGAGNIKAGSTDMCVSPNGEYLAVAIQTGAETRFRLWHKGKTVGKKYFRHSTFPKTMLLHVIVLNDGRAILQFLKSDGNKSVTDAYLLKGNTLLSHGQWSGTGTLAPDGSLFIWDGDPCYYAEISMKGGKIHPGTKCRYYGYMDTDTYGSFVSYAIPMLYNQGYIMSGDCKVYSPSGKVTHPAQGWERQYTISPGSRYTLLVNDNLVRAYSPITGDTWQITLHGFSYSGGDVTDDGRFMMLGCDRELPAPIASLLQRIGIDTAAGYELIYERPGRLRAVCRRSENWSSWWMSPDGHTMVTQEEGTANISLYRW